MCIGDFKLEHFEQYKYELIESVKQKQTERKRLSVCRRLEDIN